LHDRDECRRAVDGWRRQMVELLNLGKADVDLRHAGFAARAHELRQSMQRLRAEHDIDVRPPLYDGRPFLRWGGAAHGDHDGGAPYLERTYAAEVMEHALLRFLAHRAGVEQDDVG